MRRFALRKNIDRYSPSDHWAAGSYIGSSNFTHKHLSIALIFQRAIGFAVARICG
jgi:hypothetical protein